VKVTLAKLKAVRAVIDPYPNGVRGDGVPMNEFNAVLEWLAALAPGINMERAPALLDELIAVIEAENG
jgi:hypothetical protein